MRCGFHPETSFPLSQALDWARATGDRELELLGRYEENAYFVRMMKLAGHTDIRLYELQGHDHGETTPTGNRLLLRFVKSRGKTPPAQSNS